MTHHNAPPMYIGVAIVQSTAPTTADQPRKAPQLKARPTVSKEGDELTEDNLRIVGDALHEWVDYDEAKGASPKYDSAISTRYRDEGLTNTNLAGSELPVPLIAALQETSTRQIESHHPWL